MKLKIASWIRQRRTATNLLLSFTIVILAGVWVNLLTFDVSSGQTDFQYLLLKKRNLLVIACFLLLGIQTTYNRWIETLPASAVKDLLELASMYMVKNARPSGANIYLHEIRAFFHVPKEIKPGNRCDNEECLVPVEHFCQRPQDRGPIPIERRSYQAWYVNVKGFKNRCITSEEPDRSKRPSGEGLYINIPSQFPSLSVISCPVWKNSLPPTVGGMITFDSVRSLKELNWPDTRQGQPGDKHKELCDMLTLIAVIISKVNWTNDDPP